MPPLGKATSVQQIDPQGNKDLPTEGSKAFEEEQCYAGVIDPTWNIGRLRPRPDPSSRDPVSSNPETHRRPACYSPFPPDNDAFYFCHSHQSSQGFIWVHELDWGFLPGGVHKITAHCIFGVNAPHPKDKVNLTLNPPSSYARRIPLPTHPSEATIKRRGGTEWPFNKEICWSDESIVLARNEVDSPNRTNSSTIGGEGLEWASWAQLTDKEERITVPSLAFLADMFVNTPALLPRSERKGLGPSWFPTMTMSIEFKNKIPPPSSKHADRTVGLYSYGRFMTEPQGRHEIYFEAWTAPSNIGEGKPTENWREDQVCIATATQMALVVPFEVNQRKGKPKDTKL